MRGLSHGLGHPTSLIPSQAPINEIHGLVTDEALNMGGEARKCAERGILLFQVLTCLKATIIKITWFCSRDGPTGKEQNHSPEPGLAWVGDSHPHPHRTPGPVT